MSSMGWLAIAALISALGEFVVNAVVISQFEGKVFPPKWSFKLNKVLIVLQWSAMIFTWLVLLLIILHGAGLHPRIMIHL